MHRTRVLLVDDDLDDFQTTKMLLEDAPGEFDVEWAKDYSQGLDALKSDTFDVCMVDYIIGGETGLEFVANAGRIGIRCPMILLTGVGQHDIDIAASKAGASDFLDKNNLTPTLLERAIRYSVAHSETIAELAEQTSVLETTLESIQAGIARFSLDGRLIQTNELYRSVIETLDFSALIPSSGDALRPSVENLSIEILSKLKPRGRVGESIFESISGNFYDIRVDPILGGGDIIAIIDVTAQKKLQRRIIDAKRAAESASTMKSAFLAKVSHELRTPLNGVFGIAQLLKISELDSEQQFQLDRLIESASTLMSLIEDLLDISMIDQGEFSLRYETIKLSDIIRDACSIARAASGRRELVIEEDICAPPNAELHCDRRRVTQVLLNFFNNAIKYSSSEHITLRVNFLSSGFTRFSVIDRGPGIEESEQLRIFDRFVQVESRASMSNSGVGLGLSIAKELVEGMGGRIGVSSKIGVGSNFWFEIPSNFKQTDFLKMRLCMVAA
ncbi:MAG: ATP-binding protein [Pseudomonadota bacterium]